MVTFEVQAVARAYLKQTNLRWPLLIDESRRLYESYSMYRGSWAKIYGPRSWSAYAKLMMRGRAVQRPTGDVHQLGGDVLIDPGGIVRLHHVGSGPADRPSVESLLSTVERHS